MKLAEALLLSDDLNHQRSTLQQRIHQNLLVQEGEVPTENPEQLIEQALHLNQKLYQLQYQIECTRLSAQTLQGESLVQLLIRFDVLNENLRIVQQAIEKLHHDFPTYQTAHIRWVKATSVAELQQRADQLQAEIYQLRLTIEASNWQIDLVEVPTLQRC